MFLVWEAAKAMKKTPGEIWALPRSEKDYIFAGVKYDIDRRVEAVKRGVLGIYV